jgi:hypothetical protein
MQAGVTGQHLPAIAGGWVTVDDAPDIFAQLGKHKR